MLCGLVEMESDSTLIANRNRVSARFGSKRIISMLFPRSATAAELAGSNAIIYPVEAFQHGICFEAKVGLIFRVNCRHLNSAFS